MESLTLMIVSDVLAMTIVKRLTIFNNFNQRTFESLRRIYFIFLQLKKVRRNLFLFLLLFLWFRVENSNFGSLSRKYHNWRNTRVIVLES